MKKKNTLYYLIGVSLTYNILRLLFGFETAVISALTIITMFQFEIED